MQNITLLNPNEGVAWRRHLDWMIENRPSVSRRLYIEGMLEDYLDRFIATVVAHRGAMQQQGLTRAEAELQISDELLSEYIPDEDHQPLDGKLVGDIKESLVLLEPRTRVVQVGG
jgi:hypothetical protein